MLDIKDHFDKGEQHNSTSNFVSTNSLIANVKKLRMLNSLTLKITSQKNARIPLSRCSNQPTDQMYAKDLLNTKFMRFICMLPRTFYLPSTHKYILVGLLYVSISFILSMRIHILGTS